MRIVASPYREVKPRQARGLVRRASEVWASVCLPDGVIVVQVSRARMLRALRLAHRPVPVRVDSDGTITVGRVR